MFQPTEYLRWIRRFFGRLPYDLATSGMTTLPMSELGLPATLEDPAAWDALRARTARHVARPIRETVPTLGTTHALWGAYSALLSPGDEVVVEGPTYEPMWRIPEGLGATIVRFERPVAERFTIDPARVARAMTPRTRLVAITNLHNPSGVRTDDAVMIELAAIAARQGAHLLVDEVYAPLDALTDDDGVWHGSARGLAPNIVTTASLTKGYGLGLHRIGWVLAPEAIAARVDDAIVSNIGHAPLPHACIGVHAFEHLPAIAARARARLGTKRETVAEWMAARRDIAWSAPASGLFGFATRHDGVDVTPAIERGAAEHGVLAAAGTFFGVPHGLRVAWTLDEARLPEGLAKLGRVLDTVSPAGPPGLGARG